MFNIRDQTITAARDGLDEPRLARVISEGTAQLMDGLIEHLFGNVELWPYPVHDVAAGADLAGMADQIFQNFDRTRLDLNPSVRAMDAMGIQINPMRPDQKF